MMSEAGIAWLNVAALVFSTVGFVWLYVLSAGPAALEKRIGEKAYRRCTAYRFSSGIFIAIIMVCYGIYLLYPLPVGLPQWFPWAWWWSLAGACVLSIPFGWIWYWGVRDAGRESMYPNKSHGMHVGIYSHIRHPQAVGEHGIWVLIGLATHSPFLALYSLVWIPAAIIMSVAEERDLVIRFGRPYEEYRSRTGAIIPRQWFGAG